MLISVGFAFFFLTELNNSETLSICIKDKHNLSSVLHTFGGKTFEGRSINYCRIFLKKEENGAYFYSFSNLDNKFSKYTNGNRKQRGIRIYHFNKGNAHLCNRIHEIENIISTHRPHILGLSEANVFSHHDLSDVQIENYKLFNSKSLTNPNLNVSRLCVYIHDSLVGKLREDLMDDKFSSIWLEVGLPHKRKILVGNAYREWGLMGQADPSVSRDPSSQKDCWSGFLGQWERALAWRHEYRAP